MTFDPKQQLNSAPDPEVVEAAGPFWSLFTIAFMVGAFLWIML